MGRKTRIFIMWEGVEIDCNAVAKKVGKSYDTIAGFFTKHNCTTKKKVLARLKYLENARHSKTMASKIYKTKLGDLTVRGMSERHPHRHEVSIQMIRNRGKRHGFNSPAVWYPKCTVAAFNELLIADGIKPVSSQVHLANRAKVIDFDRASICHRFKKLEKCKHYCYCQDIRLTGVQSPLYRVGGKCYDGIQLETTYLSGGGQVTDSVQRTTVRY